MSSKNLTVLEIVVFFPSMQILYPLDLLSYPTKISFCTFSSNLPHFCLSIYVCILEPNIFKCDKLGLLFAHISCGVFSFDLVGSLCRRYVPFFNDFPLKLFEVNLHQKECFVMCVISIKKQFLQSGTCRFEIQYGRVSQCCMPMSFRYFSISMFMYFPPLSGLRISGFLPSMLFTMAMYSLNFVMASFFLRPIS